MDRTEAIACLRSIITNKVSIHGGNEEAINMAIAALVNKDTNVPSKWIPVSERMPEKDGIYLVSGGGKVWSAQCLTFGCFRGWPNDVRNPAVSAWMPLPKPWKELEEK